MGERLFGLEAELAVSAIRNGRALQSGVVVNALGHAAQQTLRHLSGGASRMFLENGGLFYIDAGNHPEWATPECSTPAQAVCHLRAGERMVAGIARLARDALEADALLVCRSNVDYAGATWGCHESYLGTRPVGAYRRWLVPHLVSRIVYSGSGGLDPSSPGIRLSLSPRAAYIAQVASSDSTSNRGIFHTRIEPLGRRGSRIHVLAGDNACSQRATWLKVGTTALVVALTETEAFRSHRLELADPVGAMKGFARDRRFRTEVELMRGRRAPMTATEIQRRLLAIVEECAGSEAFPDWSAEVCAAWKQALDLAETPEIEQSHAFDWPLKFGLLRRATARRGFTERSIAVWSDALEELSPVRAPDENAFLPLDQAGIDRLRGLGALSGADVDRARRAIAAHGLSWGALAEFNALRRELCAIDLRFGELGAGIFESLDRQGMLPNHRMVTEAQIRAASTEAPAATRASLRGHWIRRLAPERDAYRCSWDAIHGETTSLDLGDPFARTAEWKPRIEPHAVRRRAFEHFRDGNYPEAERLLRILLAHAFEPADIHCHLARLCLVTGRIDEARARVAQAWALRESAERYVVARTLWLQRALDHLEPANPAAPPAGVAGPDGPLLGMLKAVLLSGAASMEWTMTPVLARLAVRIGAAEHALLTALVEAMSGGELEALEAFEQWRSAEPVPLAECQGYAA